MRWGSQGEKIHRDLKALGEEDKGVDG